MSQVIEAVITPFENVALALGADTPAKRAAFGAALGGAALNLAQPDWAFNEDGSARPWGLLEPEAPDATSTPWYLVAGVIGAAFATLV